jgi:hypothetical protein
MALKYLTAVAVVILFLIGSVLLSLRLRVRDKIDQQDAEETDQEYPQEIVQLGTMSNQSKRNHFNRIFGADITRVL